MLRFDPAKRITAREVLLHPWLTGTTAADSPLSANVLDLMRSYNAERRIRKIFLTVQAAIRFKNKSGGQSQVGSSRESMIGLSALSLHSGQSFMTSISGMTTSSSSANASIQKGVKSSQVTKNSSVIASIDESKTSQSESVKPRALQSSKSSRPIGMTKTESSSGNNKTSSPSKIVTEKECYTPTKDISKSPKAKRASVIGIKGYAKLEPNLPEKKRRSSAETINEIKGSPVTKKEPIVGFHPKDSPTTTTVKASSHRARDTRRPSDVGFKIGELK